MRNPTTTAKICQPPRRPPPWLRLALPLGLTATACAGPTLEEPAAADAPLEVVFEERSAAASVLVRVESCSGALGPWTGRASASGLVAGAADLHFRLQAGAPTDLDLVTPLEGGPMKGTLRGNLQITPATYANPVAGMAAVHQLRFAGGLAFETAAGEMSLPAIDHYITARPVPGTCGR